MFGLFCIVYTEVSFKNYIVAPHAPQQTKSGPRSKKVGNHCYRPYVLFYRCLIY